MRLPRRRLLGWFAAVAAYPFVAAHHRPGHIRGPKRRRVAAVRVAVVSFVAPAATVPPSPSTGGYSVGYAPEGFFL